MEDALGFRTMLRRFAIALLVAGCAADAEPAAPPPPCDVICQDEVAVRALRETMKLAYNLTLQGKAVGAHDLTTACPLGGTARVFGTATSNPLQGATEVRLTYVLAACRYLFQDDEPEGNYEMTLTGTITQEGILAVQPTSTSALVMRAEQMTLGGTVYAPPLPYDAACPLELGQNGSRVSGKICGRDVSADL